MNRILLVILGVGLLAVGAQPGMGADRLPNNINMTVAGDGTLDDGRQLYNVTDVAVQVRGNRCQITMVTDRRQRLVMTGTASQRTPSCFLNSSNLGRTSAN